MEIREGDFVVRAGPGYRKAAFDYAAARLGERDKHKRMLILAVIALTISYGFQVVFAPEGREQIAFWSTPVVLVVFALGAIGVLRFTLRLPRGVEINASGDSSESAT